MSRRVVVRLDGPRVSARIDLRVGGVLVACALATLVAFAVGVGTGEYPIAPLEAAKALFGAGDEAAEFIVVTLRLPRVLVAILVGLAFALSGAIFQSLAQNPLVAPDIIGVNAGAALVAVAIIILGFPQSLLPFGAFAGALVAAIVVYLLAWKRGLSRYRLVLVGIGVNAVLGSGISFLLTRGDIYEVQRAYVWLIGSVYASDWGDVRLLIAALALLVPAALLLARALETLQLGDELARALGTRVERARLGLVVVAVALAAMAVTVAGPVGFVAFVAPHIARRLARASGASVLPAAAAVGGLLVLAADLVAQRVFAPVALPVGIVTALLGAPYFLYLLYRANRLGRAV